MKQNSLSTIAFGMLHVIKRFLKEGCTDRAASLVYTTLLSLVPLSLVGLSILSSIPWFKGAGEHIQDFIFANFVTQSAQSIVDHFKGFMQHLPNLSMTNLIALGIFSLWTIYNVSSAFNAIWQVKKQRNIFRSFLVYALILIFTPLLVGFGFVMSSLLISLPWLSAVYKIPYVAPTILWMMPYFLTFMAFILLNWILPTCKVPFSAAAVGGLVSAILFEIAKYGFTFYLAYFSSYELLYGALAVIPIFLVWLYISWLIVLIGAMISHVTATGLPKGAH